MSKKQIHRDPRVYEDQVPPLVQGKKRILGLDLGTNCGVAFTDFVPGLAGQQPPMILGQWDLSLGDYDSGPLRHLRLQQFLQILQPQLIMFEDVKFTGSKERFEGMNTLSAIVARVAKSIEFLGGLKVTVTTWAELNGIPAHGVGIGQIKKFATGKGNVGKEPVILACNERFGTDFDPDNYQNEGTDNMADAAFTCAMGLEMYSEGLQC